VKSKADNNHQKLVAWIASLKDNHGNIKRDAAGNSDLSAIRLNNNNGTINRTWLAKQLGIYDRSAFNSSRSKSAIRALEMELGLARLIREKHPTQIVAKGEIEALKIENDKLATKLLLARAELKAAQSEVSSQKRKLSQFVEIREIEIETGRNLIGIRLLNSQPEEDSE
jgi:phosphoribosylaminoimidazole carboxylase (NCAIR synthetase)